MDMNLVYVRIENEVLEMGKSGVSSDFYFGYQSSKKEKQC
jgi:hypothetical protein